MTLNLAAKGAKTAAPRSRLRLLIKAGPRAVNAGPMAHRGTSSMTQSQDLTRLPGRPQNCPVSTGPKRGPPARFNNAPFGRVRRTPAGTRAGGLTYGNDSASQQNGAGGYQREAVPVFSIATFRTSGAR